MTYDYEKTRVPDGQFTAFGKNIRFFKFSGRINILLRGRGGPIRSAGSAPGLPLRTNPLYVATGNSDRHHSPRLGRAIHDAARGRGGGGPV
jgi:hypothetical protein